MRVVFYSHTAFFETALSLVRELSRHAEVHVLIELAPAAWRTASFDVPYRSLPDGLTPAEPVVGDALPESVRDYWRDTASFQFVVHRQRRSLHPASWRTSRRALDFVAGLRPDVLHVDDVDVSPRLALALPGALPAPLVLSVHDPDPHRGEGGWRKRLARRLAFPQAARFVLHSETLLQGFCERYQVAPARVAVVPLGAYELLRAWDRAPERQPTNPPTVLFFGRLSPYKGLETLIAAAPLVASRVPDVRFVVAGGAIEGYAPPPFPPLPPPASLAIHGGYVPNTQLARLLREASVVACPYHDATQSGVVLTALAFGRPVVASAVGGLAEYIDHEATGLLVPPRDPERLADALVRVLTDDVVRQALRDGIPRALEGRLGWARAAEQTLAVYAGLLATAGA